MLQSRIDKKRTWKTLEALEEERARLILDTSPEAAASLTEIWDIEIVPDETESGEEGLPDE